MNNVELAEKIKAYLKGSKTKAKKYEDLVAVNFSIIGCDDDLYVAVKDGVLDVAPYHYDDYQASVEGAPENIEKIFAGDLDMDKALADGIIKVNGDVAKFKALAALIPAKKAETKPAAKKAEVKPAAKKAEPKKACAKAECAKPAEKKEAPKAEVKAEAKPAAKAAEVKAEVKTEAKPAAKKCCKSKK